MSRKPFIHTNPIPGCENYNAEYFAKRNMSLKSESISETVENTKKLLEDKDLQEEMVRNQEKNISKDTCDNISKFIRSAYERSSK